MQIRKIKDDTFIVIIFSGAGRAAELARRLFSISCPSLRMSRAAGADGRTHRPVVGGGMEEVGQVSQAVPTPREDSMKVGREGVGERGKPG